MSLKFGIYLVEQRIISPEQYCGLVKIQQESVRSQAKIALQRNMLTIRQVANILDAQEAASKQSPKAFHHLAIEMNYLSVTEADLLLKAQETSGVSLRALLVECGLLTENQCRVLYSHFEHITFRKSQAAPSAPAKAPQPQPAAPSEAPAKPATPSGPREPNFKRRPVIIQNRQVQV